MDAKLPPRPFVSIEADSVGLNECRARVERPRKIRFGWVVERREKRERDGKIALKAANDENELSSGFEYVVLIFTRRNFDTSLYIYIYTYILFVRVVQVKTVRGIPRNR